VAYYDALIAAWNNPTQPPPGVTGTGLAAGMSSETKLGHVNAWTITGAIPASFTATGVDIMNCIDYAEFKALTPVDKQTNILQLCSVTGPQLGGSANVSHMLPGMVVDYFGTSSKTIAALTAFSKTATQTWCKVNGYPENPNGGGGLTMIDVQAAGLS
jgi:hypothetical protein